MCTRVLSWLFILFAAGAPVAHAASDTWWDRQDAVLVIIIADGLVGDFIGADTPDGTPLMPATRSFAASSRRFIDVLATTNDREELLRQLDADLQGAGFEVERVDAVRASGDAVRTGIDEALAGTRRRALVFVLQDLVPPLRPSRDLLLELDPAPASGMRGLARIEGQVNRRLARATGVGAMKSAGSLRRQLNGLRDTNWVVATAHADLDRALAGVLGRAGANPRLGIVLTATTSTSRGEFGPVGLGSGITVDVLRVPVLAAIPGADPKRDSRPREWALPSPDWMEHGAKAERFSCVTPRTLTAPRGRTVRGARWTTAGFTLIDQRQPIAQTRLYDLALDPGENLDRSAEFPALADSLKSVLRARLFGAQPVVGLRSGASPVTLQPGSQSGLVNAATGDVLTGSQVLAAGEVLRVRLVDGAASLRLGSMQQIVVAGESHTEDTLVLYSAIWEAALVRPGSEPAVGNGDGLQVWIESDGILPRR